MKIKQNHRSLKKFNFSSKQSTKKNQILSLYLDGMVEMEEIARIVNTQISYVASVLQSNGLISGYFDLYTSTHHSINAYSRFFANRLGFKDEETAYQSVKLIDEMYHIFDNQGDRAGQHHALMMALTMFDRARWTGKQAEATIFGDWLKKQLAVSKEV